MRRKTKGVLLVLDLIIVYACFLVAYSLRYEAGWFADKGQPPLNEYNWAVLLALALWGPLSAIFHLDAPRWDSHSRLLNQALKAATCLLVLLLAVSYLQKFYYSRLMLLFFGPLLLVGIMMTRIAISAVIRDLNRRGIGVVRTVIVGSPATARMIAERWEMHQYFNNRIVSYLIPEEIYREEAHAPNGNALGTQEIPEALQKNNIGAVIFTIPLRSNSELLNLIARCQQRGIEVHLLPEFWEIYPFVDVVEMAGLPFLAVRESPSREFLKRPMDVVVSVLLLAALSPALLLFGLFLLFLNRGKVLRSEVHVGQFGRPFGMFQFQRPGLQPGDPAWKKRLGVFLDKYSFLALAELLNVVKGEMSLVGPRPETPARARLYSDWNRKRLAVKPGVTGYAQVHGLRRSSSSDAKTKYDLEYLTHASLVTDLVLLIQTAGAVLRRAFPHKTRTAAAAALSAGTPAPEQAAEVVAEQKAMSKAQSC